MMNKILNFRFLFLIGIASAATLFAPVSAQPASEPQSIGFVAAVRGDVVAIRPNNERRNLKMKSEIYLGDAVKSGARGRAHLHFRDDTVITIGRNTEIVLQDYLFEPDQSDGALTVHVKEGVFRVMGGAITEVSPENFKTTTSTATIGIRGSFYTGSMLNSQLTVVFLGGKGIFVQNEHGQVEIDQPSYGTIVPSANDKPQEPRMYSVEEIGNLITEMTEVDDEEQDENGAEENADNGEAGAEDDDVDGEQDEENGGGDNQAEDANDDNQANDNNDNPDDGDTLGSNEGDVEGFLDDGGEEDGEVAWAPKDDPAASDVNDFVDDQTTRGEQSELITDEIVQHPNWWYGAVSGSAADNQFTGTVSEPDAALFELQLDLVSYESTTALPSPGLTYYGTNYGFGSHSFVAPDGTVHTVEMDYANDNLGEFLVFTSGDRFSFGDDSSTYTRETTDPPGLPVTDDFAMHGAYLSILDTFSGTFAELGFTGLQAEQMLPADGIARYLGPGLITHTDEIRYEGVAGSLDLSVNFKTRKLLGTFVEGEEAILFCYGNISDAGTANLKFIGAGADDPGSQSPAPGEPFTVSGSGDYFSFYGSDLQGIGLTGAGSLRPLSTEQAASNFRVGSGLFKREEIDNAPRGVSPWNGFAVGVAENIAAPDVMPHFFMNESSDGLTLTIDRDKGLVSGFLSVEDNASGVSLSQLQIGAADKSAYIHDYQFIAELDGTNSVQAGDSQGSLKKSGNFMITAPADQRLSNWTSWGYWEAAYDDPAIGATYDVHTPGAMWVAGERTPRSEVQSLINQKITGYYAGGAQCVEIGLHGQLARSGSSRHDVNFAERSIASKFIFPEFYTDSGQIPGVEITGNAAISTATHDFAGGIDGVVRGGNSEAVDKSVSSLQGDFYGPAASGVGGSFRAKTENIDYIGVFGADKN